MVSVSTLPEANSGGGDPTQLPLFPVADLADAEATGAPALLTLSEAAALASRLAGKNVTTANIQYLISQGLATPERGGDRVRISADEVRARYAAAPAPAPERPDGDGAGDGAESAPNGDGAGEPDAAAELADLLSFAHCKEAETTRHIHRLHPYKGKFVPQLVEYFLDGRTDRHKREACFAPGDIVLDPFSGSGTTLVQANELGIHAVGVDISAFNALLANLKLAELPLAELAQTALRMRYAIASDVTGQRARAFDAELQTMLQEFNAEHYPTPDFRIKARAGKVNEDEYAARRMGLLRPRFYDLLRARRVSNYVGRPDAPYLRRWLLLPVHSELEAGRAFAASVSDPDLRQMLLLILSRTARSARATRHYDLATLTRPVAEPYYCGKHHKICKPVFSLLALWKRYEEDTVRRKAEFAKIRTDTRQVCLAGDSRSIDLPAALAPVSPDLSARLRERGARGVFSSPPYLGMIDYHEQHAYAYEILDLPRQDHSEIGRRSAGRGRKAQRAYVADIAAVLTNCRRWLPKDGGDIFLVANDSFNLYPDIAARAGLAIVREYRRPALNRAEGDQGDYSETIFHLRPAAEAAR